MVEECIDRSARSGPAWGRIVVKQERWPDDKTFAHSHPCALAVPSAVIHSTVLIKVAAEMQSIGHKQARRFARVLKTPRAHRGLAETPFLGGSYPLRPCESAYFSLFTKVRCSCHLSRQGRPLMQHAACCRGGGAASTSKKYRESSPGRCMHGP